MNCIRCHAVAGQANKMFSDFQPHVVAWPQVVPANTNVTFDGDGVNEDFGLEQVSRNPADRYAFRTSPLRHISLQPALATAGPTRASRMPFATISMRAAGPRSTTPRRRAWRRIFVGRCRRRNP